MTDETKAKDADAASSASGEQATHRPPAASIQGLSKKYGEAEVLQDVHFDVAQGEALVLLGASGSGKTTILRIIAGPEEPDSGSAPLHGTDATRLPAREGGAR